MISKLRFLVLAAPIGLLGLASETAALEKVSARFTEGEHGDVWNRATTPCAVQYYNTCTGWIWLLGGWDPGDQFGVWFDPCCTSGYPTHWLVDAWMFVDSTPPGGYGYTGTLDVWAADAQNRPTGSPLYTESFMPLTGWNLRDWSLAPIEVSGGPFVVTYTLPLTPGNTIVTASDHPDPVPSQGVPAAGGLCYPVSRVVHSALFADSVQTQYVTFADNTGDVEFLMDVDLICDDQPSPVQDETWGKIKALYR
jgi:hypothetical protein